MSTAATTTSLEEEYFGLFKSAFGAINSLIKSYADRLEESRRVNGGRVDGPLAHITRYLGVNDLLDDEWKRAVALAFVFAIGAFFAALLGIVYFDDEEAAQMEKEESAEKLDERELGQYTWTKNAANASPQVMDGANEVFLRDLLSRIKPAWLVRNFNHAERRLEAPWTLYKSLDAKTHFAKQHKFNFPVLLNVLVFYHLAARLGPFIPSEAVHVGEDGFDAVFATRVLHLLQHTACSKGSELKLVKKSLLLASSKHFVLFTDVVLQCNVCLCFAVEVMDLDAIAKEIYNQITPLAAGKEGQGDEAGLVITGRGWGANLAVELAHLLPNVECLAFGAAPTTNNNNNGGSTASGENITHFVYEYDVPLPAATAAGSDFNTSLFFKLLIALDQVVDFTFEDRIRLLQRKPTQQEDEENPGPTSGKQEMVESVFIKALETAELNPNFLPGTCYWFASKQRGIFKLANMEHLASLPRFWGNSGLPILSLTSVARFQEIFEENGD